MSAPLDEYLAFALQVALDAGRVAIEHYQTGVAVELKADASPVTRADRGAEQLIRQAIAARYPGSRVVGEEYGADGAPSAFRWIVDPIDGTKSFIRGVPLFGVLIALEIDGQADVGVCHMPALGETVAAATGLGCTWNGHTARASTVEHLATPLSCSPMAACSRAGSATAGENWNRRPACCAAGATATAIAWWRRGVPT